MRGRGFCRGCGLRGALGMFAHARRSRGKFDQAFKRFQNQCYSKGSTGARAGSVKGRKWPTSHAPTWPKKKPARGHYPSRLEEVPSRNLLLAGHEGELIRSDDLAMQRAGDERVALGLARLGIGNRHAIDFEGASNGAFVVGFGFHEVGEGAQLCTLGH